MLNAGKVGLLPILFLLFLSGCYEGRSRRSPPQNPGGGGPTEREYYFILFEPIYLSDEAMLANGCFKGPKSERQYRIMEWKTRLQVIKKGLEPLTQTLVVHPTIIGANDCKQLQMIEARATKGETNDGSWPQSPDEKNRMSLHLKVIFWDRDVFSYITPQTAQTLDWADVSRLRQKQINIISLHYAVLSNSEWGFFRFWMQSLPEPSRKVIAGISAPNPGTNGTQERAQQIQTESVEFFEWLRGAANDFAPRANH